MGNLRKGDWTFRSWLAASGWLPLNCARSGLCLQERLAHLRGTAHGAGLGPGGTPCGRSLGLFAGPSGTLPGGPAVRRTGTADPGELERFVAPFLARVPAGKPEWKDHGRCSLRVRLPGRPVPESACCDRDGAACPDRRPDRGRAVAALRAGDGHAAGDQALLRSRPAVVPGNPRSVYLLEALTAAGAEELTWSGPGRLALAWVTLSDKGAAGQRRRTPRARSSRPWLPSLPLCLARGSCSLTRPGRCGRSWPTWPWPRDSIWVLTTRGTGVAPGT